MSSRDKILAAVAANKPEFTPLPDIGFLKQSIANAPEKFTAILTGIGGVVTEIKNISEIAAHIKTTTQTGQRIVSTLTEMGSAAELIGELEVAPHTFQDIELTIIRAHLGVAENGAVWIKDDLLNHRVLPFICQNLAIVLQKKDIVATMHEAYEKIGDERYGFGTFIAGPSKTADIEQSLVLGAHGSRSMTVFIMDAPTKKARPSGTIA
jgi:L-lactate dehydrogenase complex protein LldG